MAENKLQMLQAKKQTPFEIYEKLWRENPEHFDPNQSAIEIDRIHRTMELLSKKVFPISDKKVADIGCGYGVIATLLLEEGAFIDGLEISDFALKRLSALDRFTPIKGALPFTKLKDDHYELVVCTDVIAELDQKNLRLGISELARIVSPSGSVLITTPLDIYSDYPLEIFLKLVETEFTVEECVVSHHSIFIRFLNFLKAPSLFWHGWKNHQFREEQLKKRTFLYLWNSAPPLAWFWRAVDLVTSPLRNWVKQNRAILAIFETVNKWVYNRGVSHVILLAKRRPIQTLTEDEAPPERPPFVKQSRWT